MDKKYPKYEDYNENQQNNETEKTTQFHPEQQQISIPQHFQLNQKLHAKHEQDKLKFPSINKMSKQQSSTHSKSQIKQSQIELPKLKQQKEQQKHIENQEKILIQNKKSQNNENMIISDKISKQQSEKGAQQISQIVCKQQKKLSTQLQYINCFDALHKSPTILLQDTQSTCAFQNSAYYQNSKLILTQPITSTQSICKFRIQNIKYCVGFGVALKQVIIKHEYNYKSQGSNQLSHGLYIITSQGYSWSHSQKQQDDILRQGFKQMYNGLIVEVRAIGEIIEFKWKRGEFKLYLPSRIREKYTLCYCAYLHEKQDSISISK